MKTLIFANAPLTCSIDLSSLGPFDQVVCADGGYHHARHYRIEPSMVIGDFDSFPLSQIPSHIETIVVKPDKDETDLELCLDYVNVKNPSHIFIIGGIGARLDHTLYNLSLAQRYPFPMTFYDEIQTVHCLRSHFTYRFKDLGLKVGDHVSFLMLHTIPIGVQVVGVEYPFTSQRFIDKKQSISNVITDVSGSIVFESGFLILTHHRD